MSGRSRDDSPAYDAVAVVPSDTTMIPATRGIYVGVAGDLVVEMVSGNSATFTAAANGILPVQVHKVKSTGTTATNIVALY